MFVAWTLTAAAVAAPAAALARPAASPAADESPVVSRAANLIGQIDHWRSRTWYWQRVMGRQRSPSAFLERKTQDLDFREWSLKLWRSRALRAREKALHPPNHQSWLCIYRYERNPSQGWHTYTGNGFYGGLQMNIGFQQRYGSWLLRTKGLAHRWTSIEQIWVAERGRRVQGWYAWPHTARVCGLI